MKSMKSVVATLFLCLGIGSIAQADSSFTLTCSSIDSTYQPYFTVVVKPAGEFVPVLEYAVNIVVQDQNGKHKLEKRATGDLSASGFELRFVGDVNDPLKPWTGLKGVSLPNGTFHAGLHLDGQVAELACKLAK